MNVWFFFAIAYAFIVAFSVVGDFILGLPRHTKFAQYLVALSDSTIHGFIGASSYLMVASILLFNYEKIDMKMVTLDVVICGLMAFLIDTDHILMAGSFNIDVSCFIVFAENNRMTTIPGHNPSDSTTILSQHHIDGDSIVCVDSARFCRFGRLAQSFAVSTGNTLVGRCLDSPFSRCDQTRIQFVASSVQVNASFAFLYVLHDNCCSTLVDCSSHEMFEFAVLPTSKNTVYSHRLACYCLKLLVIS